MGFAAGLLHLLDERRAGLVGADHHDRLRVGLPDVGHGLGDVDRVALDGALGRDLEVALLHRALDAREARLAVRVVLVEDRDLVHAHGGEVLHDRLGLVEVARAHVEDVAVEGVAQQFRPGEGADVRDPRLGEDRQDRRRGGRAHVAEEGEHPLFADELLRVLDGARRLVAVVERLEDDAAAVHAAPRVDVVEVEARAELHVLAELLRRPGKRDRLAEHDLGFRDALGEHGAGRCGQREDRSECANHVHLRDVLTPVGGMIARPGPGQKAGVSRRRTPSSGP